MRIDTSYAFVDVAAPKRRNAMVKLRMGHDAGDFEVRVPRRFKGKMHFRIFDGKECTDSYSLESDGVKLLASWSPRDHIRRRQVHYELLEWGEGGLGLRTLGASGSKRALAGLGLPSM